MNECYIVIETDYPLDLPRYTVSFVVDGVTYGRRSYVMRPSVERITSDLSEWLRYEKALGNHPREAIDALSMFVDPSYKLTKVEVPL